MSRPSERWSGRAAPGARGVLWQVRYRRSWAHVGRRGSDGQRDIAELDMSDRINEPLLASGPPGLDELSEAGTVGAQKLELGALRRRHLRRQPGGEDRNSLLGVIVKAHGRFT